MVNWINRARLLLIDILRREHLQILYMWFNVYNGVYDQLTSSMNTLMCLELLGAAPENREDIDPCTTLGNLISSFEISIPHPTSLKSPSDPTFNVIGLAEKVFDFSRDCAAAKLMDGTPTILLNHQLFDVNREKQDSMDIICESTGILFIAVVLAHEITHGINLSRLIDDVDAIEKNTPKLMLFRSYSHNGNINGGNLVERLLLDGELHLSRPPPTPPMLFLIVSADGTQVPLPKDVVDECISKRTFGPISKLINSSQHNNGQQLMSTDSREESADKLPALEPLLTFQLLPYDSASPSSPTIPMLTSMMHAR
ncbi:unnamed protein product [Rotaria socialis]|uniref:Uncharacterized protein n=2 Tax=Rotaria socialis TaxID=392032 RepID=A0A818KRD1_9BILA|nr:unnamed protein product [Rotaria socialis]